VTRSTSRHRKRMRAALWATAMSVCLFAAMAQPTTARHLSNHFAAPPDDPESEGSPPTPPARSPSAVGGAARGFASPLLAPSAMATPAVENPRPEKSRTLPSPAAALPVSAEDDDSTAAGGEFAAGAASQGPQSPQATTAPSVAINRTITPSKQPMERSPRPIVQEKASAGTSPAATLGAGDGDADASTDTLESSTATASPPPATDDEAALLQDASPQHAVVQPSSAAVASPANASTPSVPSPDTTAVEEASSPAATEAVPVATPAPSPSQNASLPSPTSPVVATPSSTPVAVSLAPTSATTPVPAAPSASQSIAADPETPMPAEDDDTPASPQPAQSAAAADPSPDEEEYPDQSRDDDAAVWPGEGMASTIPASSTPASSPSHSRLPTEEEDVNKGAADKSWPLATPSGAAGAPVIISGPGAPGVGEGSAEQPSSTLPLLMGLCALAVAVAVVAMAGPRTLLGSAMRLLRSRVAQLPTAASGANSERGSLTQGASSSDVVVEASRRRVDADPSLSSEAADVELGMQPRSNTFQAQSSALAAVAGALQSLPLRGSSTRKAAPALPDSEGSDVEDDVHADEHTANGSLKRSGVASSNAREPRLVDGTRSLVGLARVDVGASTKPVGALKLGKSLVAPAVPARTAAPAASMTARPGALHAAAKKTMDDDWASLLVGSDHADSTSATAEDSSFFSRLAEAARIGDGGSLAVPASHAAASVPQPVSLAARDTDACAAGSGWEVAVVGFDDDLLGLAGETSSTPNGAVGAVRRSSDAPPAVPTTNASATSDRDRAVAELDGWGDDW